MKRIYPILIAIGIASAGCVKDRDILLPDNPNFPQPEFPSGLKLMHYWHFNGNQSNSSLLEPDETIGGGLLAYNGVWDDVNEGTSINARNDQPAMEALRLRNPAGDFVISAPTVDYDQIVLSYAVMRTGSGAQEQHISYTTDGVTFKQDGLLVKEIAITEQWTLRFFDFRHIPAVNDNPNFAIKIRFNVNHTGDSGNNRFDNIVVEGRNFREPEVPPTPPLLALIHYWNFNNFSQGMTSLVRPNITYGGAELIYGGIWDEVLEGSDINARFNDPNGYSLRLRNPSGDLIMKLPTTGFKNIRVNYAARRTGSGAQEQIIYYSTDDGETFSTVGLNPFTYIISESYELISLDFSWLEAANNNPNFVIKVEFDVNASGTAGNNRIDNLSVEGNLY